MPSHLTVLAPLTRPHVWSSLLISLSVPFSTLPTAHPCCSIHTGLVALPQIHQSVSTSGPLHSLFLLPEHFSPHGLLPSIILISVQMSKRPSLSPPYNYSTCHSITLFFPSLCVSFLCSIMHLFVVSLLHQNRHSERGEILSPLLIANTQGLEH